MRTALFSLLFFISSLYGGELVSLDVQGYERPSETVELIGHGRGVAVTKRHVLSARHVITNSEETGFRTPRVLVNGKWIDGVICNQDPQNDLVLIELPEDCLKPVDVLTIPELQVVGSPGMAKSVSRQATIQAFKTYVKDIRELASPRDASGLSGSPLMADDRLIGIVSAAGNDAGGIFVIVIGPEPIKQLIAPIIKKD